MKLPSLISNLLILSILLLGSCKKKDPVQYELTTTILPVDGGTVSPNSGLYNEGESVILTAIPSPEYLFTGWSDGAGGTVNPLTVVMNSKRSVTANFEKRKYPLSITIDGDGTVKEEIVQTKSVTNYSSGTIVKLTANPNVGSSFNGWSGDIVSTENPVQLTINESKNINVTFKKNYYALKINTIGDGKVLKTLVSGTISDSSYIHGSVVKFEAQPAWGWKFKGWSGGIQSTDLIYTSPITGNITVVATFEKIFIPQIFYNTSTKNHEWNNGFLSTLLYSFPNYSVTSAYTYFDYNNDGQFDMFGRDDGITEENGKRIMRIHLWINHNGTWIDTPSAISTQSYSGYRKIVCADIDNDGDMDFVGFIAEDPFTNEVVVKSQPAGGIDIWRNDKGIFKLETLVPVKLGMDFFFHTGVLADINHDGWIDIVAGGGPIKVFLNDGAGNFKNDPYIAGGELTGSTELEAADLNNDGYVDILLGIGRNIYYYLNNPPSDFSTYGLTSQIFWGKGEYPYINSVPYTLPTNYNSNNATIADLKKYFNCTNDFSLTDLNNDGYLDLLTWSSAQNQDDIHFIDKSGNPWTTGNSAIQLYENNKNGTFKNITDSLFNKGENEFYGIGNWFKIWDIDKCGEKEILFEVEPFQLFNFNGWKKINGKYEKKVLNPVY